ncbi:SurA N-terminal domain-containing protein [Candidatus Shapirobacteria bacterium]|nr:SurA N-terminal domain-containing protein [Candidatus Shapirobacteria bacterium]
MKILKNLKNKLGRGKKIKKWLVLLLALVILYLARGQFIVATVNKQPISRWQLIKALESQAGTQVLEGLITESLITQEASRKGIRISLEEINQEIETIKENLTAQGQDFDLLLQMQGIDLEEVRKQIRIQKTIEKLVGEDLEVSQEEMAEYLEANKELLPEDQEGLEEQVKETLRQEKLNQAIQEALANLKEKANINYWQKL